MRALVYGAMNPDLVHVVDRVPAPGDDVRSHSWQLTWGGKAANAAVALATWGVDTRLTGLVLGLDPLGDALLDRLDRPHLDRSWIHRDADVATQHCIILLTPDGDRTIVCAGYEGSQCGRAFLDAAWSGVDVLLVDGFGGEAARAVVEEAHRRQIPVVWLDAPSGAPAATVVVWSRHEHTEAEAEALAGDGASVVLTAGPEPLIAWWGELRIEVRPPAIDPVDATGAGDVFAAAIAFGIASGWEPGRVVAHAAAAGAAGAASSRAVSPSLGTIAALFEG